PTCVLPTLEGRIDVRSNADQPGRCRYGHRLQTPADLWRDPSADRLWPVPGAEEPARAELAAPACRSGKHRCRGADPCPPRTLRLPAAADARWFLRAYLQHARQSRCG